MNYLKQGIVLEDVETGKKKIITTFEEFIALLGMEKSLARAFVNARFKEWGDEQTISMGKMIARKQEPFELI